MGDYILIDGDKANFVSAFGIATVTVQPGTLSGSGPATIGGKKMCVDGDENSVEVKNCPYVTAQYSTPGQGTIKIQALAGNQKATKTQTGGKAVLLKGALFTAVFEVTSPAKQPPPGPGSPIPDPTPQYPGQGTFQTTNNKFQGT